jgi:3-hydroxy-5-methyl-1-naphthoate 3-O-methyltransferase
LALRNSDQEYFQMTVAGAPAVTPERIQQFAWGYVPPFVIEAAIRNRVFDVLDEGPKSLEQVQAATGASARGLSAIMNVLVGLGLLQKDANGVFALTPESENFLVKSKPGFMGGMILHTSSQLVPRWLHLSEVVATGKPVAPVNQEATGSEFFQEFVTDIFPLSYPAAKVLAQLLNFGNAREPVSVLDLAAGSGVWGIAIAQSSESVRVTAVDWPDVLPVTRKTADRFGLTERFTFVAGDLLSADFGSNHAAATLGHILHSEGEDRSRKLLAKVFDALAPGGVIGIAEFLVEPSRIGPIGGLFFAVNMLVNTDVGNTYSFEEISFWLKDAGFVNPRTVDAPGPSPLILANKP